MNRSSSPPKGSAPRTAKPVHIPGKVAEAPAAFLRDDKGKPPRMPVKTPNMPMFAPVTGPRLTPEEAPGSPDDWTPHRPERPAGRKHMLICKPNVHGLINHPQFWSIRFDEIWKG